MPDQLPNVRRTFIDGRYGQIHCRIAGNATRAKATIVCLHMSPKSSQSFKDAMPYLANEYLVLAPDYPGYGESERPPAEPHVTIEDYAEAVWHVVDALGSRPVVFVGYHTGSMVAVEATHQRPDDVRGVINLSAPIFSDAELAHFNEYFSPIPLDREGNRFKIMWDRVIEYSGPEMTLEMAAESFAENLRGGEAYEWGHRAAFAYAKTYEARLAAMPHPFLLMNLADDLHDQSLRADPLIKNGRREEFAWGHGFLHAFPQEAAKVILDFANSIDLG